MFEGIAFFYCVLLSGPLFFAAWFHTRFEDTIAVAAISIVLISFLCGICGFLKESLWVILGIAAVLWLSSLTRIIVKKKYKQLVGFFSPTFISFTLVYIFLIFVHMGRMVHSWDEFSHWGDVVKVMAYIDDFSTNPKANLIFQSYVPGMALFQYFFQKLLMTFSHSAEFADWGLYFCYHLLSSIVLLPFFKVNTWKQFFPSLFLFVCTAIMPSFLEPEYLTIIYIDAFVGILAGAGFALLYQKEQSIVSYTNLLAVCFMLVMSKDVGLLFSGIIGGAWLIGSFIRTGKTNRVSRKNAMRLILMISSIAIPKILWEINIQNNQARVVFRTPIQPDVLFNVLLGIDHSYRLTVRNRFLYRILTGKITLAGVSISMIYPVLVLLIIGGFLVIHSLYGRRDIEPDIKKQRNSTLIIMSLSGVLYVFGMLAVYLFKFDQYEAERLASFDRYMSIVLDALLITLFLLFAVYVLKKKFVWGRSGLAFALVTFLLVPTEDFCRYVSRESVQSNNIVQGQYHEIVSRMNTLSEGETKAVWIIAQESNGDAIHPIRYGIRPCKTNTEVNWSLSVDKNALYDGDIWTAQISAEEWWEKLKDYDYVLIWRADESFRKGYGQLFENPGGIDSEKIYLIDHDKKKLVDTTP